MEIGLAQGTALYFACLLYVSSFDIDSARSRSGLFFALKLFICLLTWRQIYTLGAW